MTTDAATAELAGVQVSPGRLFIGERVDGTGVGRRSVLDPSTGSEITTVVEATPASGYGRECGPDGLDEYLQTKSVLVNLD